MSGTSDDADRTTATGLFHFAASYRAAADELAGHELAATHPDAPVVFLYTHALELYLKAFLRGHGITPGQLRAIGHDLAKLGARAAAIGLDFDDEDLEVIELMADPFRSRYIKTGPFRRASISALRRTCRHLHSEVGHALRKSGEPVRLRPARKRIGD